MEKQAIFTANAAKPGGSYSQAMVWGDLLFTAGITPVNPATGELAGPGIEDQTRQVLDNIGAILQAANLGLDQVLKVTVHLANLERDFAAFNAVYQEFFHRPYPVRTTVQSGLAGFLVEIDVVAGR